MNKQASEIVALLKEKIANFEYQGNLKEVGRVIEVGDGIALIYGLQNAMANELVTFEKGGLGMVLNLEHDHVGVVLMENENLIAEGDKAYRTNEVISIKVGDNLLGRIINPLGQAIDGKEEIVSAKSRPIERVAPGVMTRESVSQPLHTGIKIIDAMIPIGKGQRELIIGDRQTGKTAIVVDTIINQKKDNVYCIYVAIGQKASTVAQIANQLKKRNAMDYTVIVSATASDLAPLQYIAPYAACAIGEEWMEQGKDVLIIYDDLTKHAIAYRTISLLLKRPSGREAYPGDVFYLHSRLLERSAKLNQQHGGGSLTALPIIETQANDISAYIPTNVISITDGQLYLQSDTFNAGQRPAVDSGMSVSRVGSAAQTKAMKKVSRSMKLALAQYQEMVSFAQFGSEVDKATATIIARGQRLMELLKQPQYSPLSLSLMCVSLFLNHYHYLDELSVEQVGAFETFLHEKMQLSHNDILQEIDDTKDLSDTVIDSLHTIIKQQLAIFKDQWELSHGQ